MNRALVIAAFTAAPLIVSPALAEERTACASTSAAVALRAEVLDERLRARFTEQLRAALAARSIALCTADETSIGAPLARINLEATEAKEGKIALTVTVSDALTNKRVVRDVELADVPADGRPLMLAQAADELLRASWAELLVPDAPPPTREVPPEVADTLRPTEASTPSPKRIEMFAGLGSEAFGSGQIQIGPDVIIGAFPFERFGALLRVGVRTASSSETSKGAVDASAIVGAVTLIASVLPRTNRIGLDAGAEVFLTRAHYEGRPTIDALGRNEEGTAVHVALVPRTWIVLIGPLRAALDLRAGVPLHGVRVVATGETVAGVRGVLVGANVALGAAW